MRVPPLALGLPIVLCVFLGVSAHPAPAQTAAAAAAAAAEDATPSPSLSIRLDQTTQLDGQCQLMFVLENRMGSGIDALRAETVLLNRETRVLRLTTLDFQALPKGALRVRSFNLPGVQCEEIGRVLINALGVCTPLDASACSAALEVDSATGIEVLK
ncbi:hypothetical protein [Roseicitreum antarcticum]|uniref:Tat pathway signal sequence domain protein n=1 Tax=Roseicitreum antarcticum TaxID=564137 RepID=A0A1H2U8Y6_9RHOB|nr:hypothetical protein [Roseicitreum antarcticum]SDW52636.1 hypothetical protein SAMN04488238_102316 [Roseicitreum antarcticum]